MFSSNQLTSKNSSTTAFLMGENFDSSNLTNNHHHRQHHQQLMASSTSSSLYHLDETTREAFCDTMEIDEFTTTTTTSTKNFEELLYDSGISSDSLSSSDSSFSSCCSENLYVTTNIGATNFAEICSKKSPELPAEYSEDLDDDEKCAADSLNSSWDFNEAFRAEPCGRRSPLLDISNSSTQNSQSSLPAESPVSRKSSRNEEKKYSRKRSLRSSLTQEMFENPIKRLRPQFHRAFSTSELEIQSNYDSSPEATTTKYSLKVVNRIRSNDIAFGRIDSKYLADLINNLGEKFYEQYILIDCRYPFEYNGGHIKGAINLYDPELLRSTFYPSNESTFKNIHSKKPIFYCEFSSVRGPNMANALRELDRELNHDNYPHIDYSEIYVLSEGYRHFYENSNVQTYCEPPSYIPMFCEKYLKELRKYPFHKKNECFGFSIRSRSTQTLVRAYSANLSPCFCRSSICTCTNSLPPFHSMLGSEFSQISLKSPNQARISSPPPFCLDDSPFSSCNPP